MTLQDLLGIELPIIQAPMAGVQGSALTSPSATPEDSARCPAPCSTPRRCNASWRFLPRISHDRST